LWREIFREEFVSPAIIQKARFGNGEMYSLLDVIIFLASVAVISLSGVMMPGPVTAVTIAKGRRSGNAGALIA
jgi:hypothetical protein